MRKNFEVKNTRGTAIVAKLFAAEILKTKPGKHATVIGLEGDLGAGKTFFVKNFMRALGVRHKLTSPTFILMRSFRISKSVYRTAYHVDAYRVDADGLKKLGFRDVLKDPGNIVLIEWADRVRRILPKGTIFIKFTHRKNQNERHLTFNRR